MPGELPWGWWLRANGHMLEDEQGRRWQSVRAAFWQGELGFCDVHFAPEQHELMLRVLSLEDTQRRAELESQYELFNGDMMFWRFYMCWLQSVGMLAGKTSSGTVPNPLETGLSPEGRSVLLMLRATRDPAWEKLPMTEVLAAVATPALGTAEREREQVLQAFEATVGFRRHVFARERVGRSAVITLTGLASGPGARMPTRRVNWSLSFNDAIVRDDLFGWMAARIDRWDHWGELAYRKGADAFTQHLLGLVLASQSTAPS
jgi:hypothetical protein